MLRETGCDAVMIARGTRHAQSLADVVECLAFGIGSVRQVLCVRLCDTCKRRQTRKVPKPRGFMQMSLVNLGKTRNGQTVYQVQPRRSALYSIQNGTTKQHGRLVGEKPETSGGLVRMALDSLACRTFG